MPSNDIIIDNPYTDDGDFNIGDVDYQNVQSIIITQKGQLYQNPTLGAGITERLNSPADFFYLRATVIDELQKDYYELTEYETNYDLENSRLEIYIDAQKVN